MITATDVLALLASTRGTTFAAVESLTPVATAAANKHLLVLKRTVANVQLFNNTLDFDVYRRQVVRSSGKEDYVVSDNWFEHTSCFSLVKHRTKPDLYLYAIYNSASSEYTIDGVPATKAEVLGLLTKSAAAKLEDTSGVVYNKTNDVEHNIIPRTIKLENVVQIRTNGQTLTA
jgi:hypothetical protein